MPPPVSDLIQQIRQRPGAYVGGTEGYSLHRLPLLLLRAGALAAAEGRGDEVRLQLEEGGACTFSFNGALWPARLVPEPPGDSLARLFTLADAPPGVLLEPSIHEDLALVNALSSKFEVSVGQGGRAWRQVFGEGVPAGPLREVPPTVGTRSVVRGTRIRFVPDRAFFERTRLSVLGLSWRMEELAALYPRVTFQLHDDVRHLEERHCFARGLEDYCAQLSAPAQPLHTPWFFEGSVGTTQVRLSLQWCRTPGQRVKSWVNQLHTHGGSHLDGLHEGLLGALVHYAQVARRTSEVSTWVAQFATEGLTALLDVTVPRPVWRGPVKGALVDEACGADVAWLVREWLSARFEQESAVAAQVLDQVIGRSVAHGPACGARGRPGG